MCSFYSTEIFFNPRLENVTYYMRMDTDSCFTAPPCYDPFEVMYAQQHLYGYLGIGQDGQDFTEGMYPFVQNYAKAHPSVENMLRLNNWAWSHRDENGRESEGGFNGYGTNFEIVKLEAFRRPDVKEWLDAIEAYPEGIFKWRWGKRTDSTNIQFYYSHSLASRGCTSAICHPCHVLRHPRCYKTTLRYQICSPGR
jgi:mannosyltransferase